MNDAKQAAAPVLVVDDEPQIVAAASIALRGAGIEPVVTLSDSREVLAQIERSGAALLILDLSMPHLTGQDLLTAVSEQHPDVPVIIATAANDIATAVECMKAGAIDYLVKPIERTRLVAAAQRALELRGLREQVDGLRESLLAGEVRRPEAFSAIVTGSRSMRAIFQYVEAVAPSSQPVLITGETGTGKELVARAVHQLSGRRGEFVAVNAAGLDDTVFSDTLFGHAKGAYTGADQPRAGLVATAANGTLFLDEIGDLEPSSQIKLLRLLADRRYYPLGSDQARESNARIVVATHQDLPDMVARGVFRKDLYYRLLTHRVDLPPLRERQEDLPLLVEHFAERAARELRKRKPTIPEALYTLLRQYDFPGNVRELEALVFDAVARHEGGVMSLKTFRPLVDGAAAPIAEAAPEAEGPAAALFGPRLPTLKEAEENLIREALQRAGGNQTLAASMLGITRQALNKRLSRDRRREADT